MLLQPLNETSTLSYFINWVRKILLIWRSQLCTQSLQNGEQRRSQKGHSPVLAPLSVKQRYVYVKVSNTNCNEKNMEKYIKSFVHSPSGKVYKIYYLNSLTFLLILYKIPNPFLEVIAQNYRIINYFNSLKYFPSVHRLSGLVYKTYLHNNYKILNTHPTPFPAKKKKDGGTRRDAGNCAFNGYLNRTFAVHKLSGLVYKNNF